MKINRLILVGNPNTGKTTLFNSLTGLNQRTGNFSGVTIDIKEGKCQIGNQEYAVIDLPGCCSLQANSMDEEIAVDFLKNKTTNNDMVLFVADSTNLEKSSKLLEEIVQHYNGAMTLVLNFSDLLQISGKNINVSKLIQELKIPIIQINAKLGKNINGLQEVLTSFKTSKESKTLAHQEIIKCVRQCTEKIGENKIIKRTKAIDRWVTHGVFGYLIYFFLLFLIFQLLFTLSAYPSAIIDSGMTGLANYIDKLLPPSMLTNLISEGLISGISGVLIFVPQITFLFLFLNLLEQLGYMSRVSFLMDKLLSYFGLSGKSVIPLMSGMACAIPAIMGARNIPKKKERFITIMVIPLVSCSARLPIYTILIALLVDKNARWMGLNTQGVMLFAMYFLGFLSVLLVAKIMQLVVKIKSKTHIITDLPSYKTPMLKTVLITLYQKVSSFVFDAGKIIVGISIILWIFLNYAPGNRFKEIETKYQVLQTENKLIDYSSSIKKEKLENSYLGLVAKKLEFLITPLGYNWKIGVGLITSFAAREVFVSTMYTIYSISNSGEKQTILSRMKSDRRADNSPVYTKATILSLLFFYAFAMQCISTMATVYSETKSFKWVFLQFGYMFFMAYSLSFLIYQGLS